MSHRSRRALATCVVLVAAVGCHRNGIGSPATFPTKVIFRNESMEQADVFAVRAGMGPKRLGTVMAGRTDTLTIRAGEIPPGMTVDFVARLLARPTTPHSGPVPITPGDWLQITLPNAANTLVVLPAPNP